MFLEAKLEEASLEKANLRRAVFVDADAPLAVFSGSDLTEAVCHRARFEAAKLKNVDLTHADLSNANVSAADFSGATMTRTRLHRVIDEATIWGSRSAAIGDDPELAASEDFKPTH